MKKIEDYLSIKDNNFRKKHVILCRTKEEFDFMEPVRTSLNLGKTYWEEGYGFRLSGNHQSIKGYEQDVKDGTDYILLEAKDFMPLPETKTAFKIY